MKKTICLLVVCVMFLCSACQELQELNIFSDKNVKYVNTCMGRVFEAIKENDADAFRAVFSEKTLKEAKNTDVGSLLSFMQGEAVSWTWDELCHESAYMEYGQMSKEITTWCYIKTDERDYKVYLSAYPIDSFDPTNVGLHTLLVFTLEDENGVRKAWEDWDVPGLCIPEFDSAVGTDR